MARFVPARRPRLHGKPLIPQLSPGHIRIRDASGRTSKTASDQLPVSETTISCTIYRDPAASTGLAAPVKTTERVVLDPAMNEPDQLQEIQKSLGDRAFCWISIAEPTEGVMRHVASAFDIHELIVEDAVSAHQRPKFELYDHQLMFVLRTVNYTPGGQDIDLTPDVTTGEVQVILGENFVVTVTHGTTPDATARIEENLRRLFMPQTVLYSFADIIVDHYLTVSTQLDEDIGNMEDSVFAPETTIDIQEVYLLMREVLEIQHAIEPLTIALKLLIGDHDIIAENSRTYVRDVLDHQILAADQIRGFAERLSSLVDASAAKISLQQNTDMRKISAWAAVAVVPTMIAGIYGMNFEEMPELTWEFGYPLVIGFMIAVCAGLIALFRHNRWL